MQQTGKNGKQTKKIRIKNRIRLLYTCTLTLITKQAKIIDGAPLKHNIKIENKT